MVASRVTASVTFSQFTGLPYLWMVLGSSRSILYQLYLKCMSCFYSCMVDGIHQLVIFTVLESAQNLQNQATFPKWMYENTATIHNTI